MSTCLPIISIGIIRIFKYSYPITLFILYLSSKFVIKFFNTTIKYLKFLFTKINKIMNRSPTFKHTFYITKSIFPRIKSIHKIFFTFRIYCNISTIPRSTETSTRTFIISTFYCNTIISISKCRFI